MKALIGIAAVGLLLWGVVLVLGGKPPPPGSNELF
jgi:hypothetical protein